MIGSSPRGEISPHSAPPEDQQVCFGTLFGLCDAPQTKQATEEEPINNKKLLLIKPRGVCDAVCVSRGVGLAVGHFERVRSNSPPLW